MKIRKSSSNSWASHLSLHTLPVCAFLVAGIAGTTVQLHGQATRDAWKWPFSRNSIWNHPIGSNANYVDAQISGSPRSGPDKEYLVRSLASWPKRDLIRSGNFNSNRCGGTVDEGVDLFIQDNYIVPDAKPNNKPNNLAAFIMPNGRHVREMAPLARCTVGGPVYGKYFGQKSIYGSGRGKGVNNLGDGSHGGSGLSAYGGSIRKGELFSSEPIRHAIKFTLYGAKWLYSPQGCSLFTAKRWPAYVNDSYAGCASSAFHYDFNGIPGMKMGVLLAIPTSVSKSSLNLETGPGRKLFDALRNYGGYVVDDAAWDKHMLGIETTAVTEFQQQLGYSMNVNTSGTGNSPTPFHRDLNKLMKELHFISNNSSSSIGGGGTPLVAKAPPFKYEAEHVKYTAGGASAVTANDSNAGYDRLVRLDANSTNDYVEFELESVYAASFDLKVRYKAGNNRGKFQAKVGSSNIGSVKDAYSSSASFKTVTLGSINFSSGGTKNVRFVVTGKNSNSSSYKLFIDQVWFEENGGSGGGSSSSSSGGVLTAEHKDGFEKSF